MGTKSKNDYRFIGIKPDTYDAAKNGAKREKIYMHQYFRQAVDFYEANKANKQKNKN